MQHSRPMNAHVASSLHANGSVDFALLAISGSCIPGDGSICAVLTTLAALGESHSTTASASPAYGTVGLCLCACFVAAFSLAESDRPELARR